MIGVKVLEEKKSKFNGEIKVIRSLGFGTYIQANGLTQSGGIVETFWKQTLGKIKNSKLKVLNCLILGLGGGTVAKLTKKFWPDAKIIGVDIDPVMIELGQKYLGLDKKWVKTEIADAVNFLTYSKNKNYDLVIVDLYQGDKYPEKFAERSFLKLLDRRLAKNGLVIFNRLFYGDKKKDAKKFEKKIEKFFNKVEYYRPQANIMFICSQSSP